MRTPNFLPIEFIVVGGAISGLTAAIGLSRVGHKVTVLELMDEFHTTSMSGGCRIPPNATKIFYRWGMEQRLRQCAMKSTGIFYARFDDGSFVGSHDWEESILEETGGDFLLMHYADLRRVLTESAIEHGVTLRADALVVDVTPDQERPHVTLSTGEVLTADVIIGADGCYMSACRIRRSIIEATGQEDVEKADGWQLFNVMIPESSLGELEDTDSEFLRRIRQTGKVFTWFGSTYSALGFPTRDPATREPMFTLFVYTDREDRDFTVMYSTKDELLKWMKSCDPRLKLLAKHASKIFCIPMIRRPFLEQWVHPQGRVLAIGEAAHPISAGSIYAAGMSVGDAAVLGKIFGYLHRREQITSFLYAVQEIRATRVERLLRACLGNIFAVALPPGIAEARDRQLSEQSVRGIKSLGNGGSKTSEQMIEAIENIFAYDPEDEADNWWMKWGITEERAARIFDSEPLDVGRKTENH